MIVVDKWYAPFEDFFSHLPGGERIENIGKESRLEALKFVSKK